MSTAFGAWDTEDGLSSKFEGKVTDAYWDEGRYGVQLVLEIESPAFDQPTNAWYSAGRGVQLVSDSEVDLSLVKNGKFNTSSGVGDLITYLKKEPTLLEVVANNGSPDNAKSFVGLEAVWERIEFKRTINGEETTYKRLLPVSVLGGATPAESEDDADIPDWLGEIYATATDYDSFVSAAIDHEQITRELRKLILNEDYWKFT
jgi:hypothetical protein